MKKSFFPIGLIAFAVVIFFFLGGGTFAAEQKILKVVSTETDPNSIAVAKEIIAAYEREHPNVKIDYEEIAYGDIIKRSMASAMSG